MNLHSVQIMPRPLAQRPMASALLLCLLVAGAVLMPTRTHAQGNTRVRLATLAPKDSSFHRSLLAMGEAWREVSGGQVALQLFTDGTMGGEGDMVRRMRAGQLQAAMLTVSGLTLIDESVSALQSMPLVFRSLEELDFVRERLRADLEARMLEKGFVVLFWADAGWVQFFSSQPAHLPDEFRTLKTFVWSGHQRTVDLMKSLGIHVVPLEYSDTLTGLQTGLIEAVPTLPTYALAGQYYIHTGHMLRLNWVPLVGATVMTRKTWEAVPAVHREEMLAAARETGVQIRNQGRAESEEAVRAMQKRGLVVHEPDATQLAAWREYAEGVHPRIRGSLVPADLFDEVQRLLREFRAPAAGDATPLR